MRFVGIEYAGQHHVALIDGSVVRPVAAIEEFWSNPEHWHQGASQLGPTPPFLRREQVREIPLVPAGARVFCIGLNYRAHANEGSFDVPDYPTLFGRWTASLSVGDTPAPVPSNEKGLDWEAEVAVYIGAEVRDADESEAATAILGYSTFNDLTARTAQKLSSQWTLGKNADYSGPLGPLVTKDEAGDPRDGWPVMTRVNGTEVQRGNTKDMIFTPPAVISLISRTLTLHPGDVIATGTPAGVGYVRTPPWFLVPGDTVEVEIGPLGTLVTPIVGAAPPR